MGRRGRRVKQLLDDLKEKNRSWNLKKKSTRSHSREISVERATDLSQDRLRNDKSFGYNMHPIVYSFHKNGISPIR
jgi:hypothetical protein